MIKGPIFLKEKNEYDWERQGKRDFEVVIESNTDFSCSLINFARFTYKETSSTRKVLKGYVGHNRWWMVLLCDVSCLSGGFFK